MPNFKMPVSSNEIHVDPGTFDLINNNRIYIRGAIDDLLSLVFISSMDYLMKKGKDSVMPAPIDIYINSPGGEVYSGLVMRDKICQAKKEGFIVRTVNCGISASMASLILASGTAGERYSTEHGKVMIHQPLGVAQGQADDVFLACEQLTNAHEVLVKILAEDTRHKASVIKKLMSRDKWFTSEEAKEFGLIDKIGFPEIGG